MSIYTRFIPDDIVRANPTVVTTGLWSGDTGSLEGYIYYDQQQLTSDSGAYYFNAYDKDPDADPNGLAEIQFAITYGHVNGGGAPTLETEDNAKLPTKAIYSQYRNLLLDASDTKFSFNGVDSDHIYVINLQRNRIREQLDPGNWQLPLSGVNGIFTFVDDSGQTTGALTANSKAGRVFNVVSGSLSGSVTASSTYAGQGFGLVYPDLGLIVLNPNAICPQVGFIVSQSSLITGSVFTGSVAAPAYNPASIVERTMFAPLTGSTNTNFSWGSRASAYNHAALFNSIQAAISGSTTIGFKARSAETISSTHYFVRLRNREYNYSNNPTFYNADTGTLRFADFKNDPRVYITTIGLYNDENELLAVAKLSKPVRKSFDEELLLRVRLDF